MQPAEAPARPRAVHPATRRIGAEGPRWPPRGEHGHGYDPMFLPDGAALTFGEMDPAAKNRISHRADAFGQLVAAVF